MGLVGMAVSQVEHRMILGAATGELVHFHSRPRLLHTPRSALISLKDGRICGLNRVAVDLLQSSWKELLGRPIEEIFGAHWLKLKSRAGLFNAPCGDQWAVAVESRRPQIHSLTSAFAEPRPASGDASQLPEPSVLDGLHTTALRVVDGGLPLLVRGETGSGKDYFVRSLHAKSRRAQGPLVAVNCAALPESLIEAELFGYEEGAFTGARRKGLPGRLREAQGGILFLDEIGDMPLTLQTRLLRVLEDRRVRPLGSSRDSNLDFDLICATHHDLSKLVREGMFREDLFYRLRGFEVALPALRERSDRRSLIASVFSEISSGKSLRLSEDALDRLCNHRWPGNVRELVSVLRSAVVLSDGHGPIPGAVVARLCPGGEEAQGRGSLSDAIEDPSPSSLESLARNAINQALTKHQGNVSLTAASLGVHRSTIYRHLAMQRQGGTRMLQSFTPH